MTTISRTEEIILSHIKEENTVFVFPTGLSAITWAEQMLNHVAAVTMERFIAWDSFKSEAIRSQQQNKASIPSMMRKIFASHLIQQNAQSVARGEEPLFKNLINPEYAQTAQGFTNWLAGLLPSLESWRRSYQKAREEAKKKSLPMEQDAQDRDLLELHHRYSQFLEENHRFDPAWEQPPFHNDGNHYIIFYPEILSDFSEYRHILESSPHIVLVHCNTESQAAPNCIFYDNAPQELRETALFIRNLVAEGNLSYSDIVVSLPDMETLAPYIKRELELYAVPAVFRSGKNLADYGAGSVFTQLRGCLAQDFSFNSLKELLLNHHLPWKEMELGNELIQFGIDYNCICSYIQDNRTIDPWLEAFKDAPSQERLRAFYASLRQGAKRFASATSFEKLREAYFQFRDDFWDMSRASSETDLVLGRCITELAGLMDLEREFPQFPVPNPFDFFLQVLEEGEYLPQSKDRGVSVVPYRLLSSAPAGCHIVVGANQKDITHLFQQLGFLSQSKRNRLGLIDSNPSEAFIHLYQLHSKYPVRFSASENSFSGYTIPHNGLRLLPRSKVELKDATGSSTPLQQDFIMQEQRLFQVARGGNKATAGQVNVDFTPTALQQEGFSHWKTTVEAKSSPRTGTADQKATTPPNILLGQQHYNPHWQEKIHQALLFHPIKDEATTENPKLRISQSHLKDFFTCPRKWYFKRILRLEEPDTQAKLMRDTWMGTIYHEIILHYLQPLQRCGAPLQPPQTDESGFSSLLPEEEKRLSQAVNIVLENPKKLSPLSKDLLKAQRKSIFTTAKNLVIGLCKSFPEHQVVALEEELLCEPRQLDSLLERLATKKQYSSSSTSFPATPEERGAFYSQLQDFVLYGRLDCILNSPEDNLVLLDFKLGKTPTATESSVDPDGRLKDFQLAFYTILYEGVYPERTLDSAAFMTIKDGEITKIYGFDKVVQREEGFYSKNGKEKPAFNYSLAACIHYLREFADAITTCHFPQLGAVDYETCRACPWKRICRTTYTIGGDEV